MLGLQIFDSSPIKNFIKPSFYLFLTAGGAHNEKYFSFFLQLRHFKLWTNFECSFMKITITKYFFMDSKWFQHHWKPPCLVMIFFIFFGNSSKLSWQFVTAWTFWYDFDLLKWLCQSETDVTIAKCLNRPQFVVYIGHTLTTHI